MGLCWHANYWHTRWLITIQGWLIIVIIVIIIIIIIIIVIGEHSGAIAMVIVVVISTVYIAMWLLVGVTV